MSIARLVLLEDWMSYTHDCDPEHTIATLDPKGKVLVQNGVAFVRQHEIDMNRFAEAESDPGFQHPWIQDRLLLKLLRRAERTIIEGPVNLTAVRTALDIAEERLAHVDGPYNVISPGGWYGHHILPFRASRDGGRLLDLPGLFAGETFWLPRPHFLGIVSTRGDSTAMWMDIDRVVHLTFRSPRGRHPLHRNPQH
jgi:hypothetical protein